MTGYGASIVSFLGGIHWGIGFRNVSRMHNAPLFNFGWGVVPSLLAWVAITMPAYRWLALAGRLSCFFATPSIAKPIQRLGLEEWLPMRWLLTVGRCS